MLAGDTPVYTHSLHTWSIIGHLTNLFLDLQVKSPIHVEATPRVSKLPKDVKTVWPPKCSKKASCIFCSGYNYNFSEYLKDVKVHCDNPILNVAP
ncbi:hypothetical protein H2248_008142 [Termitomyces sp. 'cryptogamus']|nr:hypothetical protein H2248_008142 [Termitomyces sp. 'cryptogamus']